MKEKGKALTFTTLHLKDKCHYSVCQNDLWNSWSLKKKGFCFKGEHFAPICKWWESRNCDTNDINVCFNFERHYCSFYALNSFYGSILTNAVYRKLTLTFPLDEDMSLKYRKYRLCAHKMKQNLLRAFGNLLLMK